MSMELRDLDKKHTGDFQEGPVTFDAYSEAEFEYADEGFLDVNREHAGSSFLAYFNVVCIVAGTGTLGIPYALKLGGWIGLVILFLSWVMSVHTGTLLIRCLYANGKRRLGSYKEIATTCFGAVGGWVAFFFNTWILLGAPILYIVLSGSNLNELCAGTAADIGVLPWSIVSCVIVAIPFVLVKNMKEIAVMSALGATATLIVVIIVLVVACMDKPHLTNVHHDTVIWSQFPIALSTISFSFGGNGVYPHVEASMKKPKNWPKVVAAGLSTCAALYYLAAIPGYYVYGDRVVNPVYNSISNGVPKIIAISVMTFHVLAASPILLTSFALDVEEMLNITVERFGKVKEFIIRALFRIFLIVVVGIIGAVIPHFDDLMALIGAFANCALIFIFPVIFYLRLTGLRNKPIYELAWYALILLLGVVGLVFGTISAIQALVADFKS
ncbi:transmembrane amino acid transporter protein-domain-containing protein [Mycotypha africana]|uniref:transmembrane amino acid transporter protein-domain-containing protein n=1 Tax=Mycotypha africana TaxID=64632 RepID=UPI0023013DD9|nr:transmembrane amino acid transporter protein-domain-containing protein [Mycotypha africana]KAI8973524.1 transmembrane amino acid transporter protein-domain-containing protein [Mycotypha africana]